MFDNVTKFAGYVMSKEDLNLVYVPTSKHATKLQNQKYLTEMMDSLSKGKYTKDYKFLLISVPMKS